MEFFVRKSCFALLMFLGMAPGQAQEYPSHVIRLVQPNPPGGFADTVGRIISKGMSERLGQAIVTENRPGAMNYLGAQVVEHSDPDGYTILFGTIDLTMMHSFRKAATDFFPSQNLTPIAMVASTPGVYVVNPSLPIHSLADLAAAAKAKQLKNALPGIGGSLHLMSKLFELQNNVEFSFIPYRGTPEAMLAVISGEVEMGVFALQSGYANKERVRVLAQTGETRHPLLPDVPTVKEAGMPNVGMIFWFGLYAPPKTPPVIIDKLAASLKETMKDPQVSDSLARIGARAEYMPPDQFSKYNADEEAKWGKLIPQLGFEPQ